MNRAWKTIATAAMTLLMLGMAVGAAIETAVTLVGALP